MRSALSAKLADGQLTVVEIPEFEKPSTKQAKAMLQAWGLEGKTMLVIDSGDVNTYLSFRNLEKVEIITAHMMNTYDFLDNKNLVLTEKAVEYIEGVLA
jgi:large subunit ribosomal protein L4